MRLANDISFRPEDFRIISSIKINYQEEKALANHKSAVKRNKQNIVRNTRNSHIRSTLRTLVKKVRLAVTENDHEAATAELARTVPFIDKAASKGVIHKATASRKIARLTKLVNTIR